MFTVVTAFAVNPVKLEYPIQQKKLLPNTTYRINGNIDLEGQRVTIPSNCTLILARKAKIYNGEIVGNETKISSSEKCIGVKLYGSWITKDIYDSWFNIQYLSDDDIIANINCLQNDEVNQRIFIKNKKCYKCNIRDGVVLKLSSNTKLFLNSTIQLEPNDLSLYFIISIKNKRNVSVIGGNIVGDVQNHIEPLKGSAGEWGMGINISNSSNIRIEDVKIQHCWGDGVYVAGGTEKQIGDYFYASKNVYLKNVICDDNRRQGMSVEHVDGLTVVNCSFINTGKTKFTPPGHGVDIEPNFTKAQKQSCKNLMFRKCKFIGNKGAQLGEDNSFKIGDVCNIENVTFENCLFSGLVGVCLPNMTFKSCELENIIFNVSESPLCVVFDKCSITSTNSQIQKVSRRGHTDSISITMRKCHINLLDAEAWITKNLWGMVDNLTLDRCKVKLPFKKAEVVRTSGELSDLLSSSRLQYE